MPVDAITAPTALSRRSGATGKRRPAEYGDHGTTTLVYPRHRRPTTSRPLTHPFTINVFTKYYYTGVYGIPASTLREWAAGTPSPAPPPAPVYERKLKVPLPILEDYSVPPSADFWDSFPFRPIPAEPSTCINVDRFEQAIADISDLMTGWQRARARQLVANLRHGADTLIDQSRLEPDILANGKLDHEAAINCVDSVATMIRDGHVAGPFSEPPYDNFRSNKLFVVERAGKYRNILDLSSPSSASYNDSIRDDTVPPITMASVRAIADDIVEWGGDAYLSKLDHKAAFKLVPVRKSIVKYQGFSLLGKYFVETQLVFGACSSPGIYDLLHEIFLLVARLRCNGDPDHLHRTLDDFVACTPTLQENKAIVSAYMDLASEINLPLAPLDDGDKAFILKRRGVILGIELDAQYAAWRIPAEKGHRHRRAFQELLTLDLIPHKQAESVLGMAQHTCGMIPIIRPLLTPLLDMVQAAKTAGAAVATAKIRQAARVWLRILFDLLSWQPLSLPIGHSPLNAPILATKQLLDHADVPTGFLAHATTATAFMWPNRLVVNAVVEANLRLFTPRLFLNALGLLCAIVANAHTIRNQQCIITVEDELLCNLLRKGRDKKCSRTSTIFKAISFALITANASATFSVRRFSHATDAPPTPIPAPILSWIRHTRAEAQLAEAVASYLDGLGF